VKNFLVFEPSWRRIEPMLRDIPGFKPLLYTADGALSLDGQQVSDVPIHAAWLNFELGRKHSGGFIKLLAESENVEFIQSAAAGLDAPFFKRLLEKPLRFCNSDAQAPAIAEYVLASVMSRLHRFDIRYDMQNRREGRDQPFTELCESHCLVVGHGHIGARVAQLLSSFGATVSVIRRKAAGIPGVDRVGKQSDLHAFLGDADIVVLTAALNDETRGMMNEAALAACKRGAIVVNIARGALIDEDALHAALDSEHIDYAVLDVFETEPLPDDHPFWTHERVLVSAHASNAGSGRARRGDDLMVENLRNYLAQRPLRNQVDPGDYL